jgi:hypothetical protein
LLGDVRSRRDNIRSNEQEQKTMNKTPTTHNDEGTNSASAAVMLSSDEVRLMSRCLCTVRGLCLDDNEFVELVGGTDEQLESLQDTLAELSNRGSDVVNNTY